MNKHCRLWLSVIPSCLLVGACDWVDSAGSGADNQQTEVFLDDTPVGGAIVLNENSTARLTLSRGNGDPAQQVFQWSDTTLEQGNLPACANQGGYVSELAADSLAGACTSAGSCTIRFQTAETTDGVAEFLLEIPRLTAPVGVRYALSVTDSSQAVETREYDFCLVAINEAPLANDDTFVVLEGTSAFIGTDDVNLLSNDSDDIDVSNSELRILPEPAVAPRFAEEFELGEDGSFRYTPGLTGIPSDQIDSFRYALSDGVHTSTADVTIRIVARNQAPELVEEIPLLLAIEDEPFLEDLSQYFRDPEQGPLTFSFAMDGALPGAGTLRLEEDGVLSGMPDEDDVGSYVLTLVVSDGGRTAEAVLMLEVEPAPLVPDNSAPQFVEGTVFDQRVLLGRFMRPVIPVFVDPDGDPLTYAVIGRALPEGVEINEDTGVVSGHPESRTWVRGLRIEATDPYGATAVSDDFYIRVQ